MAAVLQTDWRLAAEVLLLVWRLEIRLRSLSFYPILSHLARVRVLAARPATKLALPDRAVLSDLISLAYRTTGSRPSCLRQSLILKELLWRRGLPSQLVIAVSHNRGLLKSHAWVEAGVSAPPESLPVSYQKLVAF